MWVCGRISDVIRRGIAVLAAASALAHADLARAGGGQGAPARVVSVNLCTDQLAMLLAAPGQLVSVSALARESESSALAHLAARWPVNSGSAEEVFLLRPDLVLAGSYSTRVTVGMLRRLGVEVVEFAPEESLEEVRATILRMGQVLGRQQAARDMVRAFDAGLRMVGREAGRASVTAAIYGANGYVPGANTLASDILAAAGMTSLATALGSASSGTLPLERLILAQPDVVIRPARYKGASRAEAILDHPALRALPMPKAATTGPEWVCPTPMLLHAVAEMADLHDKITEKQ